jgi:hypothetical protein
MSYEGGSGLATGWRQSVRGSGVEAIQLIGLRLVSSFATLPKATSGTPACTLKAN